jgi:AraC-like DNA-binding protein
MVVIYLVTSKKPKIPATAAACRRNNQLVIMRLTPYDIECIQKAKAFIDADMSRHHTIPEIAAHAHINTSKLRAGFKALFGTGLFSYLKEQRLQEGKYLLENSHKNLKEISRRVGYKHTCNFNTAFKKQYGKAAGSWRS